MQAVVPAAGEGTRLRPLTEDKPKGLVEVNGRPLLSHVFGALVDHVEELIVVVGYRGGEIVERFGDRFDGVPVRYVHQRERRGLAHAVLAAEPRVEGDFVVMNGDNVLRADLGGAIGRHRGAGADATLLVERATRAEAERTGVCVVEDGEVVSMVEKPDDPPSTLVHAGCSVLSPAAFDACRLVEPSGRGERELPDAIDLMVRAGRRVEAVELDGWRANLNTPDDVREVERRLAAEA